MGQKLTEAPFKVGDKVTTRYYPEDQKVVRRVTFIEQNCQYGSGYAVRVDSGTPCKCCGRAGHIIDAAIDAAWLDKA